MDGAPLPTFDVETLHARLRERLGELRPLTVVEILRVFLEVSSLPCASRLWSLAFAFDEDDGRIARLEARYARHDAQGDDLDDLRGIEVQVLLPKFIPRYDGNDEGAVLQQGPDRDLAPGSLVLRFLAALADLGAYRAIEAIEAREATPFLL